MTHTSNGPKEMATKEMTPIEVVKAVRELLDDREKWIQGNYAEDRLGKIVLPTNPEATCFCLVGAAYKVCDIEISGHGNPPALMGFLKEVNLTLNHFREDTSHLILFNDEHSHDAVLAILDVTIERLEKA